MLVPISWMLSFALETGLLLRAKRGNFLRQFPIFYSYVGFLLLANAITFSIYYAAPGFYAGYYWFSYTAWLCAEFVVLLEASDHIFEPYPAIRRLGRLLTASIGLLFLFTFILPSLLEPRSRPLALLELTRSTSLTKAVLILVLLSAARLYQLPLGKNISGMLLGFAAYLAMTVVNMALAESLGRSVYGGVFAIVLPLSYLMRLVIWNVALWRYEPVPLAPRGPREGAKGIAYIQSEEMARYSSEFIRLLRR